MGLPRGRRGWGRLGAPLRPAGGHARALGACRGAPPARGLSRRDSLHAAGAPGAPDAHAAGLERRAPFPSASVHCRGGTDSNYQPKGESGIWASGELSPAVLE